MKCCVSSCNNDSKLLSESHRITFHALPADPNLRVKWLKAIGNDLSDNKHVCSEHFMIKDIYVSKNGMWKVRENAVPRSPICRICLGTDMKLYRMGSNDLEEVYEQLTGITHTDVELPQYACVECAHRLINCCQFKSKCLKSHQMLQELLKRSDCLSFNSVKNIDRESTQLKSNLVIKTLLEQYDLRVYEEIPALDDLKVENETFNDNDDDNVIVVTDMDIDDDMINDVNNDLDEAVNDSYNNDNESISGDAKIKSDDPYSSGDDLLSELKHKKRKKGKKQIVKKVRKKKIEPKVDRRRKPLLNSDLNETLFTITDLTFEEQVSDIQKRQESANYKNSVFKCTVCFKGFLDEAAYNGHMMRHTDQCGEYECDICKTHFKHSHALRKHKTAHHTQRYSCNHCPYVTTHRQTARLHERWHKGTKYQCPHCMEEFVKFTTYMGHKRIKHPSDFVCELCGYSFVSEKGIELHKKLKHRLDSYEIPLDGPLCELCNVRFLSGEAYRRHLSVSGRHKESKSKENKSRKVRKPREMRSRERASDDEADERRYPSRKAEGPIPCEQCGIQLEDSRAYHTHFRRMHPDKNRTNYPSMKSPCMCEVCGRIFQSQALLKDHRWVHTGEKPFSCEECGKQFRMKQRLVAHRQVHSEVRATYQCALCGKHFSTHGNCQRHMFIHTGLRPFKCEMCGKCFKQASEKRAHITYVHLKKPWPKRTRGKRGEKTDQLESGAMTVASEIEISESIWPPCEQKDSSIEKPLYYSIKM